MLSCILEGLQKGPPTFNGIIHYITLVNEVASPSMFL